MFMLFMFLLRGEHYAPACPRPEGLVWRACLIVSVPRVLPPLRSKGNVLANRGQSWGFLSVPQVWALFSFGCRNRASLQNMLYDRNLLYVWHIVTAVFTRGQYHTTYSKHVILTSMFSMSSDMNGLDSSIPMAYLTLDHQLQVLQEWGVLSPFIFNADWYW